MDNDIGLRIFIDPLYSLHLHKIIVLAPRNKNVLTIALLQSLYHKRAKKP
jgi:hypothetical protein